MSERLCSCSLFKLTDDNLGVFGLSWPISEAILGEAFNGSLVTRA